MVETSHRQVEAEKTGSGAETLGNDVLMDPYTCHYTRTNFSKHLNLRSSTRPSSTSYSMTAIFQPPLFPRNPNLTLITQFHSFPGHKFQLVNLFFAILLYLANSTRPDIALLMSRLDLHLWNPALQHMIILNQAL